MDKAAILADLRDQFGPARSTLYADELATVLGKSTKAIYSLKYRNGLPVPVLPGPGRPCVSIHAVVDWLAGESTPPTVKSEAGAPSPVPKPGRKRPSMGAYLTTLRGQMDFLNELHSELERVEMQNEALEAASGDQEPL